LRVDDLLLAIGVDGMGRQVGAGGVVQVLVTDYRDLPRPDIDQAGDDDRVAQDAARGLGGVVHRALLGAEPFGTSPCGEARRAWWVCGEQPHVCQSSWRKALWPTPGCREHARALLVGAGTCRPL